MLHPLLWSPWVSTFLPSGVLSECFLITKSTPEQWSLDIKAHGRKGKLFCWNGKGGPSFPISSVSVVPPCLHCQPSLGKLAVRDDWGRDFCSQLLLLVLKRKDTQLSNQDFQLGWKLYSRVNESGGAISSAVRWSSGAQILGILAKVKAGWVQHCQVPCSAAICLLRYPSSICSP